MATVRVLIVDDDQTVLEILAAYLDRNGGYETVTTSDPKKALEIVQNNTIDLLIADIMMPDLLGPKLFDEVKKVSPRTACIFISGYGEEIYNLPPDVLFLKKPISAAAFFSTIEKVLGQSV